MNSIAPQVLLDQSFEDIGQYGQAVGWDMDFRQLDSGKLDARATVIAGQKVQLIKFGLNRGFHQMGSSSEGLLTFGILDPNIQMISWCSREMCGGSMANFNRQGGFDCVSGAGFEGYAVAIPPDVLLRLAEQIGSYEIVENLLDYHATWNSSNTIAIGEMLGGIFNNASQPGSNVLNEYASVVDEEIPLAILGELIGHTISPEKFSAFARRKLLKKALNVVNNPDEIPISVAELCVRIGTSSSTLNRLFVTEYGISPKSYIRCRCLSAVRDELANAHPGTKIADIANRWGFWHMGQFAADYRAMFKELPSNTLPRK